MEGSVCLQVRGRGVKCVEGTGERPERLIFLQWSVNVWSLCVCVCESFVRVCFVCVFVVVCLCVVRVFLCVLLLVLCSTVTRIPVLQALCMMQHATRSRSATVLILQPTLDPQASVSVSGDVGLVSRACLRQLRREATGCQPDSLWRKVEDRHSSVPKMLMIREVQRWAST